MAQGALAAAQIGASLIPQKSSGSGSSFGSSYGQSGSYGQGSQSSSNVSPFGLQEGYSGTSLGQQIQPDLTSYLNMLQKAMTGGGLSGAGIPMAQAAIAQARGAAAANLGSAENFLARSGASNSPFAGQLLSSIAAQGNEATAQAPVGIYQQLLSQIPGFISSTEGQSLSAMGQAGALNNTSTSNYNNANNTYSHTTDRQYNNSSQSSGPFGF